MFITFEGIDGSGKSTQIELLQNRLSDIGREVTVFREPGGTLVSEEVREILLNIDAEIHPVTELLLFSAARSQLIAEEVIPLLERDAVVILDRFYDSTTAYQGYGRGSLPLKQIQEINEIASHRQQPDLTFYLKLSLEQAQERTHGQHKDRMERSGEAFFKKVIKGFDALSVSEERFVTLDATAPREQIHQRIWDQVAPRFA